MAHWLVKTEPEVYSIDHLEKDRSTIWDSIRNYQARNFLQAMQFGDLVLVYHSNSEPSGVVGIASVSKLASPDPTQFDRKSEYFDEKATKDKPRWFAPVLSFQVKFQVLVSIQEMRKQSKLKNLELLRRGSRLSVHPVTCEEFELIKKLGSAPYAVSKNASKKR